MKCDTNVICTLQLQIYWNNQNGCAHKSGQSNLYYWNKLKNRANTMCIYIYFYNSKFQDISLKFIRYINSSNEVKHFLIYAVHCRREIRQERKRIRDAGVLYHGLIHLIIDAGRKLLVATP